MLDGVTQSLASLQGHHAEAQCRLQASHAELQVGGGTLTGGRLVVQAACWQRWQRPTLLPCREPPARSLRCVQSLQNQRALCCLPCRPAWQRSVPRRRS